MPPKRRYDVDRLAEAAEKSTSNAKTALDKSMRKTAAPGGGGLAITCRHAQAVRKACRVISQPFATCTPQTQVRRA
ncbi:MAG: hypothetical protein VX193_02440, partial [Candidatus Thermoplasmatota archaeon]|nr:hypothetical protein [Candidatus Thermoplasmatota archaeon]